MIEPEPETLGPDLPASERVLPSLVEAAISTPLVELVRCFGDLDGLGLVDSTYRRNWNPSQRLWTLNRQLLNLHATLYRAKRQEGSV